MADETVSATTIINAPAEAIFAVLADPAHHAAVESDARLPPTGFNRTLRRTLPQGPSLMVQAAGMNDGTGGGSEVHGVAEHSRAVPPAPRVER